MPFFARDNSQALAPNNALASPHDPTTDPLAPDLLPDDSLDPVFTEETLYALTLALPSQEQQTDEQKIRRQAAAFSALRSFDAQHPSEAMLATHAVVAHHFALECYRRAARSSQTSNLNTRLLGSAAMLSRTMGGMLASLDQRQDDPIWVGPPGPR
ncbi:MAG TPA: hypothetical protein VKT26_01945 [Acetobacteraceae bacterium]|nr:hypothetical protein [Acetobacteraceae bacterium]